MGKDYLDTFAEDSALYVKTPLNKDLLKSKLDQMVTALYNGAEHYTIGIKLGINTIESSVGERVEANPKKALVEAYDFWAIRHLTTILEAKGERVLGVKVNNSTIEALCFRGEFFYSYRIARTIGLTEILLKGVVVGFDPRSRLLTEGI
jgi:hypothetical protein